MSSFTETTLFPRHLSSASMQPQQTQNTAPIIEYSCLYTRDLRRKAKRWQDGLLRFHTFNKRIMVYDIPRNYIGDTHWRESQQLQDGDEIELDRPVLVEVGEQLRTIEQDLTGLFDRRHKDTGVDRLAELHRISPPMKVVSREPRVEISIPSQLRPKSLNALLGTPKGRSGRAALPTKSPHQLQKEHENIARRPEPPAKRQRVVSPAERPPLVVETRHVPVTVADREAEKENEDASNKSCLSSVRDTRRSDDQLKKGSRPGAKLQLPQPKSTARAPMSRDVDVRIDDASNSSCENAGPSTFQITIPNPRQRMQETKRQSQETQPQYSSESKTQLTSAWKKLPEPSKIAEPRSDADRISSDSNQQLRPKVRLQMASCKPRKKLMYRDLLPQDAPAQSKSWNGASLISGVSQQESLSEQRPVQSNYLLTERHKEEQDRLEARLQRHYANIRRKSGDEPVSSNTNEPFGTVRRLGNCKAAARDSSEQNYGRQQPEDIVGHPKSSSVRAVEMIVPKVICVAHNASLTLAKMDEILLSRSQPSKSSTQAGSQLCSSGLLAQEHARSPRPSTSPDPVVRDISPVTDLERARQAQPSHTHSITQIPSSQLFEAQISPPSDVQPSPVGGKCMKPSSKNLVAAPPKTSPPKSSTFVVSPKKNFATIAVSTEGESLDVAKAPQELSSATKHGTRSAKLPATSLLETSPVPPKGANLAQLPAPSSTNSKLQNESARLRILSGGVALDGPRATKRVTSLPHFRPLRPTTVNQRSPIKKAVSDLTSDTNVRPAFNVPKSALTDGLGGGASDQLVSPWSREAWDLFGCGRDGAFVPYRDFCLQERS